MSRDSVASVTSAASLPQVRYRLLTEVDSTSIGMARNCTGGNFILVGANTYTPVGGMGGLDPVQEDADPFPRAVRLWFAAVNTSQVVDMVNEALFNKAVRVYRAFVDDAITLIGTPQLLWKGKINTVQFLTNDPQRGNYYEIECESRLRRVSRAQYFDAHTLRVVLGNSGDTFFDYVPLIPLRRAPWGQLPYGVGGTPMALPAPPGQPGGPNSNPFGAPSKQPSGGPNSNPFGAPSAPGNNQGGFNWGL